MAFANAGIENVNRPSENVVEPHRYAQALYGENSIRFCGNYMHPCQSERIGMGALLYEHAIWLKTVFYAFKPSVWQKVTDFTTDERL